MASNLNKPLIFVIKPLMFENLAAVHLLYLHVCLFKNSLRNCFGIRNAVFLTQLADIYSIILLQV